ncbi:uncharacterized protein PHACADRAFT_192678 [Phanerochaete carnosa HHB-10118-sp]|uniref:Uncharacterized protein n=1 Tax=Phanerochaete carnosa (strain HHB-10118-sp) TaxID=650164 RepID=K5W111_PHACS|nr:uncharacterized protein PHACADRAFT_192678 [Phanerochaete carnosa HHB-10118-sp]EKM57533.1 hypothetical protein PHACADRAFT_192678 [Phanerochaete carnosa HHB-10118-sp]
MNRPHTAANQQRMMLYTAGAIVTAGVLWYGTKGSESVKAARNDQAKPGTPDKKVDENPKAQSGPETRKSAV